MKRPQSVHICQREAGQDEALRLGNYMIRLFENVFFGLEVSSHKIGAFAEEHLRLFGRGLFHKLPCHFRHRTMRPEIPTVDDRPVRRVDDETISPWKTVIYMYRL